MRIYVWSFGFVLIKKLVDFDNHNLLLDELRKNKIHNIKDICNAFKNENKYKLKDQQHDTLQNYFVIMKHMLQLQGTQFIF